jgi:uncharacterized protein (TIGR03083 family)
MPALDPRAGASVAADVTAGVTAAWRAQNRALADLLRAHDLDTAVPTCPGWTLANLATHVGRGDRWAATIVARRMDTALPMREVPDGKPPEGGAVGWLLAGVDALATAVATTGPTTPVWTFTGPQPAAWWLRRRLHECLVHRADVALAVGAPFEVPAEVAADGVSEWLTRLTARSGAEPLAEGTSMHLHATEDLGPAGEWMVRPGGDGVTWEPGHAKGTVAVRGPAADLLLVLVRRLPPERVQVLGDAAVLERWLARTDF